MLDDTVATRVLDCIDSDALIELTSDLAAMPSPTGRERPAAELVVAWLRRNGFRAFVQEVEGEQCNAVGLLPGAGTAPSLMFNGHLDSSFSGLPEDALIAGEVREQWTMRPRVEGGRLFGNGVLNDKGPVACFLIAAKAIKESGTALCGDLLLAAVASEIGRAPVDGYEGTAFRGKGSGTRYLLTHGVVSDYAIVAEPSQLQPTWALPGAAFLKATVRGHALYAPFTSRGADPRQSSNAIVRAAALVLAVEEWAATYEQAHSKGYECGTIAPKVTIGAIAGGAPYKPNFSAGVCRVYLEAYVPPEMRPLDAQRELAAFLSERGIPAEVEMYLSVNGQVGRGVAPVVAALREGYRRLFGREMAPAPSGYTSMWADANVYNELGIPTVKCGPSPADMAALATAEFQEVDDLLSAARLYALAAVQICGVGD